MTWGRCWGHLKGSGAQHCPAEEVRVADEVAQRPGRVRARFVLIVRQERHQRPDSGLQDRVQRIAVISYGAKRDASGCLHLKEVPCVFMHVCGQRACTAVQVANMLDCAVTPGALTISQQGKLRHVQDRSPR